MSSRDDPQTQTTLNIPSLVAFAVITILAIRYLFFSPSSSTSGSSAFPPSARAGATRRGPMTPPDRIEQVAAMFPQLSRRDIEWDLYRNGASVAATTERVLREGRLPQPPPSFQAQPAAGTTPSTAAADGAAARNGQQKQSYTDLITRYNLASRVSAASASESGVQENEAEGKAEKGGWSQSKAERQALLKRRREEMVLAARRKMEERDRKGKEKAGA